MHSFIYGDVTFEKMYEIIKEYVESDKESRYVLTVGTDSQNRQLTKVVIVVALERVGKGGIYFHEEIMNKKITNLQEKLHFETTKSLETAGKLMEKIESDNYAIKIDSIHVDVGDVGPSSKYKKEIVSWVTACGFRCKTKPYSYTASCIANRLTKF